MGFNVARSDNLTKDELMDIAMNDINEGDKLPAKSTLIDTTSRTQTKVYENAMIQLVNDGRIELKTGRGYYATTPTYDFDLGSF
jgi:DNA-binding FadR family transcriptional regulator